MEKEEIIILVVTVSIVLAAFGLLFVFIYILYKKKQRLHLQKIQSLTEQMLQSQIEIQEQAFADISRELHDNIGQQLTLAKLHLNTLKNITENNDIEKIAESKDLISDSIYQIRDIAKTLLGERINAIGIDEAIKNETSRIHKIGICEVSYFTEGEPFAINPQKEIILFRIIQEALNNAVKHATACNIDIRLNYTASQMNISIKDNGKGFIQGKDKQSGIGLMNMRSRAAAIGSKLLITSEPGKGTLIEIIIEKTQTIPI